MAERTLQFDHEGYHVQMTVWNENKETPPTVLYDWHNVLDAYTVDELAKTAGVDQSQPYAVMSLLATKGDNFEQLKAWSLQTGLCVVAVTAKFRGKREACETSVKFKAMQRMNWRHVTHAFDDKPHEWIPTDRTRYVSTVLELPPKAKPVYLIHYK